jgi:hypothetical protein
MVGYAATAARVDFTVGNVTAVGANGKARVLTKGAQVEQGDTISTNNGRAQLRFTDGAYVSLQPDSQFRIDQYSFNGKADGKEKGFFSLLKGGLRTVTGLVGRNNKQNYQVTTSVATIGIRGTEYTIQYGKSIVGTVGEGEIAVCNGAGCLSVTNGESYYVQNQDIKPVLTNKRTDLPPASPDEPPPSFEQGETVNAQGEPCDLFPETCVGPAPAPATSLNGTFAAFMALAHTLYSGQGGAHTDAGSAYSGPATFDLGKMVSMTDNEGGTVTPGTTSMVDAGGDQYIAWGRLVNGTLGGTISGSGDHAGGVLTGNESFAYVVGLPTPTMPTLGSVTYTLLGATTPVFATGSGVVGLGVLESLTLMANLAGGGTTSGNFSMTIKDPSLNLITVSNTASSFVGSGNVIAGTGSGSGPSCSGTCNVAINGFFAGANAERAGISYRVDAICGVFSCSGVGVAALKR